MVVAARATRCPGLGACLDSLRVQEHRNLEILVVLDDVTGRDAEVVRRHAAEDWRISLVAAPGGRTAAARNTGAGLARGTYLAFARSEDTVPPAALRRLVGTLETSGSDFAFGRLAEVGALHRNVSTVAHPAHEAPRQAVSLPEFPLAVTDIFDDNRLYRTSFFRAAGLSFPAGAGPTPALQSFARSQRFDVVAETTYHRSSRGAGRPIGALVSAMADLDEWLASQRVVQDFLAAGDNAEMLQAWSFAVCDVEVVPLLDDAERATPEQWEALRSFLTAVRRRMTPQSWALVRAESRTKVWLAIEGHREALEHFAVQRIFELGNRRTEVVDGRVLARFGGLGSLAEQGVSVPEDCLEMSERETPLRVHLHNARWLDGRRLAVDLFAFISFVSYTEGTSATNRPPEARAWLVRRDVAAETVFDDELDAGEPAAASQGGGPDGPGGRAGSDALRLELPVERFADPEANLVGGHRHQDYRLGGLRVVLDAELVPPAEAGGRDAWALEVEVTARGLTRTGTVTSRDERTATGLLGQAVHGPRLVGEGTAARLVALRAAARGGAAVTVMPAWPVHAQELTTRGRTVSGVLAGAGLEHLGAGGPREPAVAVVASGPRGERAGAEVVPTGAGTATFTVTLPPLAGEPDQPTPRRWSTAVVLRQSGAAAPVEVPLGFPGGVSGRFAPSAATGEVVASRGTRGGTELWESVRTVVVDSVTMADGELRLAGRWLGTAPSDWRLALVSPRARLEVTGAATSGSATSPGSTTDPGGFSAVVPTTWDEWGLGSRPVPVGTYYLELTAAGGADVRVLMGDELLPRLAQPVVGRDHRMVAVRHGRGLAVRLAPALTDDERGPYAQRSLQEWSASAEVGSDPNAVYLQSYTGQSATDSQRAIHDELRGTRPDLTLYWAVASAATAVPEGGVPLLMHSREWYRVLGSAGYLCCNIDFDRWFRRKPEQQFLQTFHGYPAKSMGIRLWEAKQFTPKRVGLELARTSRDWTLILTPTPEMDRYYREEYAYRGEIESNGYPRDDALLAPDAEAVRRRTRELLGIAAGQTAVLYAPTWRDDQATNYRSAAMTRHLDLESATTSLGDDYVFLMRGHRFHAQANEREGGRTARLLDVTDYPEINDLILAADAAVLDYSSLRFDFALTGRPMLFLVPDLGSYTGGVRGFLYPFEESAPGPLLTDAAEVVAALRDLPRVSRDYERAYARFNQTYNYLQDGRAAQRVVRRFFC